MDLKSGTPVKDVRGRRLGHVSAVLSCCIQVSEQQLAVTREAVFLVGEFGVELICDADQLGRYACPLHTRGGP